MSGQIHYSIRVTGKVQGVFYRQSTKEKARELGVMGWVKNLPDGSVQIAAEGSSEQVAQLLEWAKQGPEMAVVENVTSEQGPWEGFDTFEVRR